METPKVRIAPNSVIVDSLQKLSRIMVEAAEESITNTINMGGRLGEAVDTVRRLTPTTTVGKTRPVPCCPPVDECPPQCLLEITRHAYAGEVILVPFRIRNNSGQARTYQIGVRPLVDENLNPAPRQPTLDKTSATIQSGQSVVVEIRIDLTNGFGTGRQYEATIVIREHEINQNVCFRLIIDPLRAPEVEPYDEKDLKKHFLSWHYHFYCEEKPAHFIVVGKENESYATVKRTNIPPKG